MAVKAEAVNNRLSAIIQKAACTVGYPNLRSEQERAVLAFMLGKDVFVSLPTGSGKSLCYTILPTTFIVLRQSSIFNLVLVCTHVE